MLCVNYASIKKELMKSRKMVLMNLFASSVGKESACNTADLGSVPGLGRSPGGGNGYPRQYSCLENPMDRGAWWATAHGAAIESG